MTFGQNYMDEGVGDEITAIDAIDGTHLQSKEGEYSLKAHTANMMESHELIIPSASEGKNLDRSGVLDHPRRMEDAGGMVEELTLRNYDGTTNLAVVDTSNNRDRMHQPNQLQHLYQMLGGSGNGSSLADAAFKDNGRPTSTVWDDVGYTFFPHTLGQKPSDDYHNEVMENASNAENKAGSSNTLSSAGGIRTKMLSKSGFSEYFIKNSLKGKGVICRGPTRDQSISKDSGSAQAASDAPLISSPKTSLHPSHGFARPGSGLCPDSFQEGVNLRECLKTGRPKINKLESLHLFRQILDLVDFSHSQGVALQDLRPSCFKLLPSNQVIYVGSSAQKEMMENDKDQNISCSENDRNEKRPLEQGTHPAVRQWAKKQKFGGNMNVIKRWPQFPSRSGFKSATANDTGVSIPGPQDSGSDFNEGHNLKMEYRSQGNSGSPRLSNTSQLVLGSVSDTLEEKWYTSPDEVNGRGCTFFSNIYSLGVLLFELLGSFDTGRARAVAMLDLHHRILPPNFLSENPKEAGFCLWLLHPEPSSRPTTRAILQSDFVRGIQGSCEDELSSNIKEDDDESELLLHFLISLKEQKQKDTFKLVEEIKFLEADIEEVERRQTTKSPDLLCPSKGSLAWGNRFLNTEHSSSGVHSNLLPISSNELRLTRNINQLESAYFSVRTNIQLSDIDMTARTNNEVLKYRDSCLWTLKDEEKPKPTDRLGAFFNGLCKYARYSKFEVRGTLRNGDFNSSANVICSLSFDRDEDYFATAGVSKKIKIFEFNALFNDSVDNHYPVVEMSNRSKLSCICWNSYIRNYLASTDYDGIVKLWDAGTGQGFSQYIEHDKRAWSVDFSQVDPTKLASASDDCSVKLWNINERNSLCTIKNIANVCCIQFSSHSSHLLAFGSADYKTYCYDLRNVSTPWCVLAGHDRAVSHVKFLDSETLVSASTDNSLKLWDLNKTCSNGLSTTACSLTLKGHTNEKNFVGLSVADGYIACGSETNEVYAYYRSLPMPVTSHKFGSIDPISGKETDNDNGQFVSSVCWRRKSDMVVAANSTGCIKVLEMV